MQYRKFMPTGKEISLLGTGTMRLPLCSDQTINEEEAIKMIRQSIDCGVNYIDTAYMYHQGTSEELVGKALKDGYREKVFLADKMPVWMAKNQEEMENIFYTQLKRCQVESFDMYLVHNITKDIWVKVLEYDTLPFLEEMKRQGKIKHLGFSFHDELDFFKEIVDFYPWEFCQIQLNYMDTGFQAGVEGLEYASSKGLPIIIMEPLKGGKLTDKLPPVVEEYWQKSNRDWTPAKWAFRWVANFPQVLTILSGMSDLPQLEENIKIMEDALPNSLTQRDLETLSQVAKKYNELTPYGCTNCKYCLPCPKQIEIPDVINLYNDWFVYEENPKTKAVFQVFIDKDHRPSTCIGCKKCEDHCPQQLPVQRIMDEAAQLFQK